MSIAKYATTLIMHDGRLTIVRKLSDGNLEYVEPVVEKTTMFCRIGCVSVSWEALRRLVELQNACG